MLSYNNEIPNTNLFMVETYAESKTFGFFKAFIQKGHLFGPLQIAKLVCSQFDGFLTEHMNYSFELENKPVCLILLSIIQ